MSVYGGSFRTPTIDGAGTGCECGVHPRRTADHLRESVVSEIVGPFRKSSYSSQQGECVEVAETAPGGRVVRDGKVEGGPLLSVSRESWRAFLGQFG
ncbi:DUF397 domain-containing protein [Streptomyces sp. NPDC047860]|uniref:DUF397 domain-containing protein n=1 Tax=Streptomyces sp. NPDC047860 TaxID=3155743 RepID=UPI0033D48ADE